MPRVLVDTEAFPFQFRMHDLDEATPATYIGDQFYFSRYKYYPSNPQIVVNGFVIQELLPYQEHTDSLVFPPRFGIVEYHIPVEKEPAQIEDWIRYPETSLPHFLLGLSNEELLLRSLGKNPTIIAGVTFNNVGQAMFELMRPHKFQSFLGSELTPNQWNKLLFPFIDAP